MQIRLVGMGSCVAESSELPSRDASSDMPAYGRSWYHADAISNGDTAMHLQSVSIEGYRSFKECVKLDLDPQVTVILGANDHGKTNLLEALEHINADSPFDSDSDTNWDVEDSAAGTSPIIRYKFTLSEEERKTLLDIENAARSGHIVNEEDPDTETDGDDNEVAEEEEVEDSLPPAKFKSIPRTVTLERCGELKAHWLESDDLTAAAVKHLSKEMVPRIELIPPQDKIPDSVTAEQFGTDEYEFMRGIFYYAGISSDEAESLFQQTDQTTRRLEIASETLNVTLRESWKQGSNLQFLLQHDSAEQCIQLRIKDPAVTARHVRASRRSSGFTQFFAMKTILHARQQENHANSFIWLFDEPGLHLHPSGQHDLLQVLEALSQTSQIVYATHSVFMINRNFPARHRMVSKTESGTRIDAKPHSGKWGAVLSGLGLTLTNPLLFANHVLLTEGDSDPTFILSIMQRLIQEGKLDIDLNSFAAFSTGDSKHAEVLIRLLREADSTPHVALLFDGDEGGKTRAKKLSKTLDAFDIQCKVLQHQTEIEDHLIAPSLYVSAVADYAASILVSQGKSKLDTDDNRAKFAESFDQYNKKLSGGLTGVADWANSAAKDISGIDSPSKVGIAREYSLQVADAKKIPASDMQRSLRLCKWIAEALSMEGRRDVDDSIVTESESRT